MSILKRLAGDLLVYRNEEGGFPRMETRFDASKFEIYMMRVKAGTVALPRVSRCP